MSKFSFRWGVSLFDNARTEIPNLILKYYHKVPVTNTEMIFILHLASFRYETEGSAAQPSLTKTLKERMGYKSNQGIINIEQALVDKGLLIVHKSQGRRSEYDFTPFSERLLAIAPNPSTKLDDPNPSIKLDDFGDPSTKVDYHPSTKLDGSRQQNLTRIREEEKEFKEENKSAASRRPPAIQVYKIFVEETKKRCLNNSQIEEIDRIVGHDPEALKTWRESIRAWNMCGNKLTDANGMLDWFHSGKRSNYDPKGQTNGNQTKRTPPPADSTEPPPGVDPQTWAKLRPKAAT